MPFSEETIRRERLLQELMEGFDPVMLNLLLSLLGTYALICIGARVLHRQPCTVLWPTACYTIGQSVDLSIYERSQAANWPLVTQEAFDLGSLHF